MSIKHSWHIITEDVEPQEMTMEVVEAIEKATGGKVLVGEAHPLSDDVPTVLNNKAFHAVKALARRTLTALDVVGLPKTSVMYAQWRIWADMALPTTNGAIEEASVRDRAVEAIEEAQMRVGAAIEASEAVRESLGALKEVMSKKL